jgi:hypothetical protein
MTTAIELVREGKLQELWQMCCGFLSLDINEFMKIQRRLLEQQLELLNHCELGRKIMRGARPHTVEEFRQVAPLTTYKDYCPELIEKREDILPARPSEWVHSSGRSGEYPCKWIPLTPDFIREMSVIARGLIILCSCKDWGDTSEVIECPNVINAVAPRPYMSGAMANMILLQSPVNFMPPLEEMGNLSFEERVQLGFKQALSRGLDGFCGLSLVLVKVGEKFSQASNRTSLLPYLKQPRAALRLAGGLIKSKLARRPMLPRDLWDIKGILSGGLDSWVYKEKIKELWGRYPLDVYCGSEGGIYASQAWDYDGMTFVPNLNFFEFIPEDELIKLEMDRTYRPRTLLLDEVKAGESYEILLTNFHGGAMVRYRPGDMVRITSLRNDKLGIDIPQMTFERRVDGLLDFYVVRITEKNIWAAIESTGVPYVDWVAFKDTGKSVLSVFIELQDGVSVSDNALSNALYKQIMETENDEKADLLEEDFVASVGFKVQVTALPRGTFADFTARKQAQGADLAHLKPPHIQPSGEELTLLVRKPEPIVTVAEQPPGDGRVTTQL